jgi:type IV pilus assembly protein PilO
MTNLQSSQAPEEQILRQRILLGVPIGVGVLIASVLSAGLLVPQLLRLRSDSQRLAELQALEQRIPLIRRQLDQTALDRDKAEQQQRKILALIQGSGKFLTFLSQIDREASRNGVQLELYEPVATRAAAQPDGQAEGEQAPPPETPLEQAGLTAEQVLLSARGSYPRLLGFLRAVEQLSLLAIPSDFRMVLVNPAAATGANQQGRLPPGTPAVPELKLLLTYYKVPEGGLKPRPVEAAADAPEAPPAPSAPAPIPPAPPGVE